jgi:hypothetical protein
MTDQSIQDKLNQLSNTVSLMWDMMEVTKWHAAMYLTELIEEKLDFEQAFDRIVDRYGITIALDLFKKELGISRMKYRDALTLKTLIAKNYAVDTPKRVRQLVEEYLMKKDLADMTEYQKYEVVASVKIRNKKEKAQ